MTSLFPRLAALALLAAMIGGVFMSSIAAADCRIDNGNGRFSRCG